MPGMPDTPRSVAIVLLSAIGDVVHGMPLVTSLKRAWPGARITWVIQPVSHALVEPHPDVDEYVVFDRSRGLRAFRDFRKAVSGRRFEVGDGAASDEDLADCRLFEPGNRAQDGGFPTA